MSLRQLVFSALLLASFAFFAATLTRMARVMLKGRHFDGAFQDMPRRIGDVLLYFFFQRTVAREALSWHHLPIFWGFLIITLGSAEVLVNGVVPAFSFELFGTTFNNIFKGALDVTNLVVLCAVIYALLRRLIKKPRLLPFNFEAGLILGMIGLLCISHFLMHGFSGHAVKTMPISMVFAGFSAGMGGGTAHVIAELNYWLHVGILLFFLNYIPYSKHIHLLGALPNILTRNRKQPGILPKLDLEDEDQWGVGRYEQFHWKSLLDTYACTECARCSNNCPAFNTGKPLSPMHLIHDIRYEMAERGAELLKLSPGVKAVVSEDDDNAVEPTAADKVIIEALENKPPMVGGRIKDDTLWACTSCGACEAVCPVFIEHPQKIIEMRQHLVLAESRMPPELARMFRGMENNMNPWGIGSDQRMDWAEGLDIPVMSEKGNADYLVWIGCAGSFDDQAKKISIAWVKLLQKAGVDFAVLGLEEGCTGDAARRAGNEFLFQMMAETNVELFNEYKVKKILTTCPHCYHSFKNEYPQFGGSYDVYHHTEFLQQLVEEGRLESGNSQSGSVVYHDPCYLGRWNGIYDEPRELLKSTCGGAAPVEMERHGYKSFCCGAGGAHMWMEEEGERVNVNRTQEAVATGAKTIATACPFCNVMVSDGVKALDKEEEVEVLDVAQMLWAAQTPASSESQELEVGSDA